MSTSSSRTRKVAVLFIGLFAIGWWWMGWDFSDWKVAGRYVSNSGDVHNSLQLKPDHTFEQEMIVHGQTKYASGSWRRFGQAGVAFSNSFLGASPSAVTDNNLHGMLDSTFGFITLTLTPRYDATPARFHKQLFR
jgi:hypothetical protein